MVSIRCKMIVQEELKKLGLHSVFINLGEAEILENITKQQRKQLENVLLKSGLELIDDKKAILIEKIKSVIIEMIFYSDEPPKTNLSDLLNKKLNYNYTYLSNFFCESQGMNIEHFVILLKIERAKEFILYDELNFSEIAYRLNYSSVAHLSMQFKKITGLTPSYFKKLKRKSMVHL
jgi:YesN/AraC family two-component response regulator